MKRYIHSTTQKEVLNQICADLIVQGKNARLDYDHRCVYVYNENGDPIEQHFAAESPEKQETKKFRYREVGPDEVGTHVKVFYDAKVRDYTDVDHLINYIHSTNHDNVDRRNNK